MTGATPWVASALATSCGKAPLTRVALVSDPVGRDARGYEAGAAPHPPTGHQRLGGVGNEGAFTFSHLKTVSSDYESELNMYEI